MGGGGGGHYRFNGGAGSGEIESGTFAVTSGTEYSVVVGIGGNCYSKGNSPETGQPSSMGTLLTVKGGQVDCQNGGYSGANGGSGGGGAGQNLFSPMRCTSGANGGSAGSDAVACNNKVGGHGQGIAVLSIFKNKTFSAGVGGSAGRVDYRKDGWSYVAAGGGGGVLVNGEGPWAGSGTGSLYHGNGGQGYGAGGGTGGDDPEYAKGNGGKGAPGPVYVEWDY